MHLEGIELTIVLQNLACTVANIYCRITQKWHGKRYINLELQIKKFNRNPSRNKWAAFFNEFYAGFLKFVVNL